MNDIMTVICEQYVHWCYDSTLFEPNGINEQVMKEKKNLKVLTFCTKCQIFQSKRGEEVEENKRPLDGANVQLMIYPKQLANQYQGYQN